MNVLMTITAYEALVERAEVISQSYPFNVRTDDAHDGILWLAVKDSEATLMWVEYERGYYDEPGSRRTVTTTFPVELLTMPANEVEAWRENYQKEDVRRIAEEADRLRKKAREDADVRAAAKEASDQREYRRLKAKFEGAKQ